MAVEKMLKRNGCDTFLCLNVQEAVERIRQSSNTEPVVFDLVLISESIISADLCLLLHQLTEYINSKRTIICGMVAHTISFNQKWTNDGFSNDNSNLTIPLSKIAQAALQQPIRPSAIDKALLLQNKKSHHDSDMSGVNKDVLIAKMKNVRSAANTSKSQSIKSVGIRLSVEDLNMLGVKLVS
jgi:hypothetical protein